MSLSKYLIHAKYCFMQIKNNYFPTITCIVKLNKNFLMIDSYKIFWAKSFEFKGRSTRSEYWWAYLANIIIYFLLAIFIGISSAINETLGLFFNLIYILYSVGQFIPSISICIRRVRDMGKSWQWIFINLIPIVGAIWYIILLCQPSLPKV